MGLLELYNQITNGILPSGDDKKHIDNMPLGNPQWENKEDNVTSYGKTTQQLTGTPTSNDYPVGPTQNFIQIYNKDNTYLNEIYTNTNNDAESPLSKSLDSSQLDGQNNPNPDPTNYPIEAQAQGTGAQPYEQKYYNETGKEYDDNIDRNSTSNSPLTDRLGDSNEYAPDELAGPFNFTSSLQFKYYA